MKKILSLISFVLIAFAAHAEEDVIIKPTCAQVGTTAKVAIVVKHDPSRGAGPAAATLFTYSIPDGTILTGISKVAGDLDYNPLNCMVLADSFGEATEGKPDGAVICYLEIEIPEDMAVGEYPIALTDVQIVYDDGETDFTLDRVESTLTVQKTAVIEPLTDGYSLEVLPFVAKEGSSTIDVLFKSAATAKSVTFDIELPQGMMFYDENFDPSKAVLNASACTKTPTTTLTITDEDNANKASVSVMGQNTGAAALRKYINQLDELTTLVSIPVYVVPADEIADWGDEYALNEGVYEVKLNNIVVTDYASNATFTGNYIASIIVGQPSAQEAILYGNYDNATTDAFTSALKNVAFANTTAATFAEGALLEDVILTKDNTNITFYTRTSENYGTTVLPYDLEEDLNCTLYTVKDISSESIVIEETDFVAANTPCIFKGTLTAYGEFVPTLGAIADQTVGFTTFKGTYEATNIAAGAGYYISSNGKFYADGATVRPFRAYFEGNVNGVKSFSVKVDTPNGLIDITDQLSDEAIYSLQGIRMNNAQKGINIKGGKKVYVK